MSNCCTVAPNTLRIPISRKRFSMVKDARPARPIQQMKIARPAKILVILLISSSVKNFFPNSWSTNWYSKGYAGLYFLNIFSIDCQCFLDVSRLIQSYTDRIWSYWLSKNTIIGSTGVNGDSMTTLSVTPITVNVFHISFACHRIFQSHRFTAALFNNIEDESKACLKNLFLQSFDAHCFCKVTSVARPETIISDVCRFSFLVRAGDLHHISVMGDEVLVTALIIPVFNNSCFITVKFLSYPV